MKKKKSKIVLLEGFLTPVLYDVLSQNGYNNITRTSYQDFIKTPTGHTLPDLIVGSFQDKKQDEKVNDYCLKKSIAWLPYRFIPERNLLDIGPLVKHADTACLRCYEKRLDENNIRYRKTSKGKKQLQLVSVLHILQVVEMCLDNKICPEKHQNIIFSLHFPAAQMTQYALLQNPLCPSCRTVFPDEKIRISPKQIIYSENGLRTVSSKETWQRTRRYIHHAGLITGLIQRDNSIRDLSPFQAISADPLGNNRFRTHAGKGISLTQNKISAALEAIERYCAKYAMLDPFQKEKTSSFHKIRQNAVSPAVFQIPIKGYTDSKNIPWIKAWSLKRNDNVYIPLEYVSLIPIGSNGLASGNCLEEAILHAIFELIERDIYMIMDLHVMVMPDLEIGSIKNKRILYLLQELDKSKVSYRIKYIKTDTGIPTFGMYITGKVKNRNGYSYALCTHLDRDIALSRTITEAIQQFPKWKISTRWLHKDTSHYTQKSEISIAMQDIATYKPTDLKSAIVRCVTLLDQLGLEPYVVNHSLPGLEFAVVRVLIPGLQPIWFRESNYLTDRVFSLPGKLGFPARKKEDLNYGQYSGFPYFAK